MTIDWWTLGFQTVNVAILIWLLSHFFWKPVAAIIEARKAATEKLSDDARAAKTQANQELVEVGRTRAGFAQEREAILAAAHKDAESQHAAHLADAETKAAALRGVARAAIISDAKAAAAAWADRSSDLAVVIAQRLALRLDSVAVEGCFLDWLAAEIARLPKKARDSAEAKLQATTAGKLGPAQRKRVVAVISDALGCKAHVTFKSDPALIAGIELRGDHLIVNSSWRADLAAIRADLNPKIAA